MRLRENAALWWVSNQSDDLLCLPYCRVQRLDYQVRTALRAIGPLQGRALLSDEVGLGKTIEAGLIGKELFTRGMVKRMLVLTLPSLVDQWEEELAEKFDLVAATTNHAAFATDPAAFWRGPSVIVASLHTFKLPVHLAEAGVVAWDLVIVVEAHYLRKRESQAWQAVNQLKRQFMLMLTATPVQNSLEEHYNLVTLLKPGQLPSPKEFRARFLDPKQPRQPREPEELASPTRPGHDPQHPRQFRPRFAAASGRNRAVHSAACRVGPVDRVGGRAASRIDRIAGQSGEPVGAVTPARAR